jgi:hypothetical protein
MKRGISYDPEKQGIRRIRLRNRSDLTWQCLPDAHRLAQIVLESKAWVSQK